MDWEGRSCLRFLVVDIIFNDKTGNVKQSKAKQSLLVLGLSCYCCRCRRRVCQINEMIFH